MSLAASKQRLGIIGNDFKSPGTIADDQLVVLLFEKDGCSIFKASSEQFFIVDLLADLYGLGVVFQRSRDVILLVATVASLLEGRGFSG